MTQLASDTGFKPLLFQPPVCILSFFFFLESLLCGGGSGLQTSQHRIITCLNCILKNVCVVLCQLAVSLLLLPHLVCSK